MITLGTEERKVLERWARGNGRKALRARIVLEAAKGQTVAAIAARLATRPATVSKWRARFARGRLSGLEDKPRSGAPATYGAEAEERILAKLAEPPPEGRACWTGKLLAQALGGISVHQVWRVLRQRRISLARRRNWFVVADPEFTGKSVEVIGLYLGSPENALVLGVGELHGAQAPEHVHGWLRLPNKDAFEEFSRSYRQSGTLTLLAALDGVTRLAKAGRYRRHRRWGVLGFLDQIVAYHPNREIHAIVESSVTRAEKYEAWRRRHKNVHLQFFPTFRSWLDQAMTWFSILLPTPSEGSAPAWSDRMRAAITAFVKAYGQGSTSFEWVKAAMDPAWAEGILREFAKLSKERFWDALTDPRWWRR